jgi:LmbE family N-acetylglucosaminyl deacetylase
MKLTIIPADACVYKDHVSYSGLVLLGVPENVHALQWNGTRGWIEFIEDDNFNKPANELIGELPDWAIAAVSTWDAAKAAEDEHIAQTQPIEVTTL